MRPRLRPSDAFRDIRSQRAITSQSAQRIVAVADSIAVSNITVVVPKYWWVVCAWREHRGAVGDEQDLFTFEKRKSNTRCQV